MQQYSLPGDIIEKFVQVAASNIPNNNGHIETLAYLVGYEENNILHGTHLVFPNQKGTCSKVDDQGKKPLHFKYCLNQTRFFFLPFRD